MCGCFSSLRKIHTNLNDLRASIKYSFSGFCKLNPDPSVRYMCHVPGVGFKTCKKYVAPGTMVNPICNTPIYYTTESLQYMKCNFGFWEYIAQCSAGLVAMHFFQVKKPISTSKDLLITRSLLVLTGFVHNKSIY